VPAEPALAQDPELAAQPTLSEVDPLELWAGILPIVDAKRPLQSAWARNGVQLGFERNTVKVGFHSKDSICRDSLQRPATKQFLEETLSEYAGYKVRIELVINDSVVPQVAAPVVEAAPAVVEEPPPWEEPAVAAAPAAEPAEDTFYDDPLIKIALQKFKARVLPNS
jgi:hypothetical protein